MHDAHQSVKGEETESDEVIRKTKKICLGLIGEGEFRSRAEAVFDFLPFVEMTVTSSSRIGESTTTCSASEASYIRDCGIEYERRKTEALQFLRSLPMIDISTERISHDLENSKKLLRRLRELDDDAVKIKSRANNYIMSPINV